MLDTNIVSSMIRDRQGPAWERLRSLDATASVSLIVAGELRFGALRAGSSRLAAAVDTVLDALVIEPMTPPVADVYGRLRASLEIAGQPMDAHDLWIASHALALGRTLATHDRAFDRVPGLAVEDWLA